MARRRPHPYVWATWVTKLLAGECHCLWAAWFRAHHVYERLPRDFDLAAWTADHTEMVGRCFDSLAADGYAVKKEGQNSFRLRGRSGAVLCGKPDLVAVDGLDVRVIDCKTGVPRTSDQVQMKLYTLALALPGQPYQGLRVRGELIYRSGAQALPTESGHGVFRRHLVSVLEKLTSEVEPQHTPSYDECRRCDISREHCPFRVEEPPSETDVWFF